MGVYTDNLCFVIKYIGFKHEYVRLSARHVAGYGNSAAVMQCSYYWQCFKL